MRIGLLRLSAFILVTLLSLQGCTRVFEKYVEYETVLPDTFPRLHAVGYAPISTQPGGSESEKMIMAMRASKLDAYRELAEQVYGQQLDGQQALGAMVIQDSQLNASINGVIKGARVIKTYAVGEDTYATEMSLDMKQVHDIYISTSKQQRVKSVQYY